MTEFYTYILECSDRSLYTGYTVDLEKRLKNHNSGRASKYTASRLPVKLAAYWTFDSKSTAMRMEAAIKKLRREEKLHLISSNIDSCQLKKALLA